MRTHKRAQREKGVVFTLVSCEGFSSFRSRPESTEKQHRLHDERCIIFRRKEVKVLIVLSSQTTWGMLHFLRMIMRLESIKLSVLKKQRYLVWRRLGGQELTTLVSKGAFSSLELMPNESGGPRGSEFLISGGVRRMIA